MSSDFVDEESERAWNKDMRRAERRAITDSEFRCLLDLTMVSDPWPDTPENNVIFLNLVDRQARMRGYDGWVVAYHEFMKETPNAQT